MGTLRYLLFQLIGSLQIQMTRSRVSLRSSQQGSPESSDDSSDPKSPDNARSPTRGRRGEHVKSDSVEMMDTKS